MTDGSVKQALSYVLTLRRLMAICTGQMRRLDLALMDDEEKTQARAGLCLLYADDGGSSAVVTLQGLRGYDKALAQLADRTRACRGTPLAKADFYPQLLPDQTPYVAKPDVGVGRNEKTFDAATDFIAAYIPVARQNEPGIVSDIDTEFLHDGNSP